MIKIEGSKVFFFPVQFLVQDTGHLFPSGMELPGCTRNLGNRICEEKLREVWASCSLAKRVCGRIEQWSSSM